MKPFNIPQLKPCALQMFKSLPLYPEEGFPMIIIGNFLIQR